MLGLDQTAMLIDALRPPPGMAIDAAIGTTFTLDLSALLAVPVAASFAEQEDEGADLLETIRRYADRTILFCQAGAISVPAYRAALTFVEQTVVEVSKPDGGLFHPKSWIVRFTSGRGRVRHRVLVMSRNLTFDRAWDVLVRLDEDPECSAAIDTAPLVDFIAGVAGAAARPLTLAQQELVGSIRDTARRARMAVPSPFTDGAFEPLRPGRRVFPFYDRCDHALAISPFLTHRPVADFLGTATTWRGVVSRAGGLDGVASVLTGVEDVKRIKDAVLDAQQSVDPVFEPTAEDEDSAEGVDLGPAMRGLHAKIFVQDVGDRSTAWLGSANLTDAALSRNWELLVRLTGSRRDVGYDAVLSRKPEQNNLSWLVEDHELPEEDAPEDESPLVGHAFDLASADITVTLTVQEHIRAELRISPCRPPEDVVMQARLLSQPDFITFESGVATWDGLALHQITPFVVLQLRAPSETRSVLVRAHLIGDDYEERRGAVLAHAIANRDDFMRYLAALLGLGPLGGYPVDADGAGGWFAGNLDADKVLEDLLATASRHPRRLASLEQTLRRLETDSRFAEIVPSDFRELWAAVYTARKGAIR
jgi:hypothetical protein